MLRRYLVFLILSGGLLLFVVYGYRADKVEIEYKPLFIPVKLIIDTQGNVSIEGEASLVTFLGEFSVGAEYELKREEDTLLVILRDRKKGGEGFDTIYRIRSSRDEFVAVVNGKTTIQIVNRQVLIDITDGSVESLEFKEASDTIAETTGSFWKPFLFGYRPFAFARWAYDDSTIDRWCGLGFLWFLIRLILSIVLLILDFILIVILGAGMVLHSLFGETVRNIYFGLLILIVIGPILWLYKAGGSKKDIRRKVEGRKKTKKEDSSRTLPGAGLH